jgi:hypothetical protein
MDPKVAASQDGRSERLLVSGVSREAATRRMTVVFVTAIHLDAGNGHEHITSVRWWDPSDDTRGTTSTEDMIEFIEEKKGVVRVTDGSTIVNVGVVKPGEAKKPYLKTYADKTWTDNLLARPRF